MTDHKPSGLSLRFKGAFQTALAMVITYGLVLAFDWERTKWAAIAVAVISVPLLSTAIQRGVHRMLGTLVAACVALTIIALFPQDRWLFILSVAIWVALCTYMMGDVKHNYFWHVGGFVASIIAWSTVGAGGDSFLIAMDRTLETGLGIAVYSLVAVLIWPQRPEEEQVAASAASGIFFPDPDRLAAGIKVFIGVWLGFLAVVYVPGFPAEFGFLSLFVPMAMTLADKPQLPVKALYIPVAVAIVASSLLYMLVMPALDGFAQLAILIFLYCFAFSYHYHEPQQALGRLFGLVLFASISGISNDQSYTFQAVANTSLMFICLFILLLITAHLPRSTRPEKAFLRLLQRFERSATVLASTPHMAHWRQAFHRHEIASIPQKLAAWQQFVNPLLIQTQQEELDALMRSLNAVQSTLLAAGTQDDIGPALDQFNARQAVIEWAGWRAPRF